MPFEIRPTGKARNFGSYDDLHVYCYRIESTPPDPPFFSGDRANPGFVYGLDFPPGVIIEDPAVYKEIVQAHPRKDLLDYRIHFEPDLGGNQVIYRVLPPNTKTRVLDFCIIARSVRDGKGPVSIDAARATRAGGPVGSFTTFNAPTARRAVDGPFAMSAASAPPDPATFLARYEGVKLASTLSLAMFPPQAVLTQLAIAPSLEALLGGSALESRTAFPSSLEGASGVGGEPDRRRRRKRRA